MSDQPDGYQTYALRLWRAPCQGEWHWRASLESRHTGERQSFAELEELFAFLRERCAEWEVETGRHPAQSTGCSSDGEG